VSPSPDEVSQERGKKEKGGFAPLRRLLPSGGEKWGRLCLSSSPVGWCGENCGISRGCREGGRVGKDKKE